MGTSGRATLSSVGGQVILAAVARRLPLSCVGALGAGRVAVREVTCKPRIILIALLACRPGGQLCSIPALAAAYLH